MGKIISFIIPARNEESYICGCLRSIGREAAGVEYEIIVVDNDSTDRTRQTIAACFPQAKCIQEKNHGTNPARQRGFAESSGNIVIFIDADVRLPRGWLGRVLSELDSDPRVVAVSGPYSFYDFPWYWKAANVLLLASFVPFVEIFINWLGIVAQLTGGCMVIRRKALDAIGGLDTSKIFYGDDTGTAMRLRKVGQVKYRYKYRVLSSARRYLKRGVFRTLGAYMMNLASIWIFRRPYGNEGEIIR